MLIAAAKLESHLAAFRQSMLELWKRSEQDLLDRGILSRPTSWGESPFDLEKYHLTGEASRQLEKEGSIPELLLKVNTLISSILSVFFSLTIEHMPDAQPTLKFYSIPYVVEGNTFVAKVHIHYTDPAGV